MFSLSTKYERPDLGDGDGYDPQAKAKMEIARWTGELLDRNYPGHPWFCEVIMARMGGVIKMQLRGLMPPDRWYVVKLSDVTSDPGGRRTVLKGAGELLERYNIPRRGFSFDHWKEAHNRAPIKGRGHLEPLR